MEGGESRKRSGSRLNLFRRSSSKDRLDEGSAGGSACASASSQARSVVSGCQGPTGMTLQQQKQLNKAERPAQRRTLESKREQLRSYIVCIQPHTDTHITQRTSNNDTFHILQHTQRMMKTDLARAERELKSVEAELAKLGVFDELDMDVAVPALAPPLVVVQQQQNQTRHRRLASASSSFNLASLAGTSSALPAVPPPAAAASSAAAAAAPSGVLQEEMGGSASSSSAAGGGKDNRSSRSRLSIRSLLSDRHHSSHRSKSARPHSSAQDVTAVMPLVAILAAEQQTVPRVIRGCCDFLREGTGARLDVEGLFRISPNQEALRFVLAAFVESSTPCTLADCDLCREDPHLAAAVLKRYLSEYIEDALLSDEAFQCFTALSRKEGGLEACVREARHVIEKVVPPAQRTVLHYLVLFFRDVAAHSAHNKMDSGNIALVFGPSLFHLQMAGSAYDSVAQSAVASNTIRLLIDHYNDIFRNNNRHKNKGHRSSLAKKKKPQEDKQKHQQQQKKDDIPPPPAEDAPAAAAAAPPELSTSSRRKSLGRSWRRSGRRKSGAAAAPVPTDDAADVPPPAGTPPRRVSLTTSMRLSGRGSRAGSVSPGGAAGQGLTGSRRLLSIVRPDGTSPSRSLQGSMRAQASQMASTCEGEGSASNSLSLSARLAEVGKE